MNLKLLLFEKLTGMLLLLLLSLVSVAQTSLTGTLNIDGRTTLTTAGSPYIITSNYSISENDTLYLEPGVELQVGTGLYVYGALIADGATITSSEASPAAGDYIFSIGNVASGYRGYVSLSNTSVSYLERLYVRYGDVVLNNATTITSPGYENIAISGGSTLVVDNVTLSGSTSNAITGGESAILTMSNLSVSGESTAISLNNATMNLSSSTAEGATYGLSFQNDSKVTLTDVTVQNCVSPIRFTDTDSVRLAGTNSFTGNENDYIVLSNFSYSNSKESFLDDFGIPYYVSSRLTVGATSGLTLAPNTIFKMGYGTIWNVYGTLKAEATDAELIYFTSWSDDNIGGDTNGNGSADEATANRWQGIAFLGSSADASVIDKATIKWASYTTNNAGIICESSAPSITNCTITNSYFGARFTGVSNATFSNNVIGSSTVTPVAMSFEADPVFAGNSFSTSDNEYDGIGLLGGTLSADANIVKRDFTDIPNVSYILLSSIEVPAGNTLNVEPGVVIKSLNGYYLNVSGTLTSLGALGEPVVFTSVNDDNYGNPNDTRNDGNEQTPAIGHFGGIYFAPTSGASVMDSTLIKFANYGGDFDAIANGSQSYSSAIAINGADVTINDCRITDVNYGVTFQNSDATITNTEIANSTYAPFRMSLSSDPTFADNTFTSVGWKGIAILNENVSYTATLKKRDVAGIVNATYIFEGLNILDGAQITVDPGLYLKGTAYASINVYGGFKVAGTAEEPVIFTSIADDNVGSGSDTDKDTEGNGNDTDPNNVHWESIIFQESSDDAFSGIDHAELWYGGYYTYAPVRWISAAAPLSNSTLKFSSGYGVYLENKSNPLITNVAIESSNNDPIAMSFFANPTFTDITFDENGSNGLRLIESSLESDAQLISRDIAGIQNIAYIMGSLDIRNTASLTINAGVVLKLVNAQINVYDGAITAIGTENAKIIFTSTADDSRGGDTNNDGNESEPTAGNWGGIDIKETTIQSHLSYCEFRYGGSANQYTRPLYEEGTNHIISRNSAPVIENSIIQLCSSGGFGAYGTSTATFSNNRIENICSTCTPLHISMFANPTFSGNTLENIGYWGIGVRDETFTQDATFPFRSFAGVDSVTYLIGSLGVASGTTITIPAGMVFKKNGSNNGFNVEGKIIVAGTAEKPVIFTSIADDAYGNPSDVQSNGPAASIPISTYYSWIDFANISDDESVVDHALFKYMRAGITLSSSAPTIQNSVFENTYYGIDASGLSEPILTANEFKNLSYAPYVTSIVAWPASMQNNTLTGTTWKGIMVRDETLTQDTTLVKRSFGGMDNVPYIFHAYTVGTGVKLSVDPGVIMKFVGFYTYNGGSGSLTVKGAFHAVGAPDADSTIIITNLVDDFYGGSTDGGGNGDGYAANFTGITFANESSDSESILENVVVKNARTGVTLNSASPTFRNVAFVDNYYWALSITGASNPTIEACDFLDNGNSSTSYGALNNTGSFQVSALNSWWGSNSGPYHATLNEAGEGDAIVGDVLFDPWATENMINPLTGDISLNGNVSAYDAALGLQAVAELISLSDKQQIAADASGNDDVSAMDAAYILQYAAGIIDWFPAEAENKRIVQAFASTDSEVVAALGDATIDEVEQKIDLPISLTNVQELYALKLVLTLPAGFTFESFEQSVLFGTPLTVNYQENQSKLIITFAQPTPLAEAQSLGVLSLSANANLTDALSVLSFDKVIGNETDVTAFSKPGEVYVNANVLAVNNSGLALYPNPASEYLTVTVPSDYQFGKLIVTDLNGRKVIKASIGGEKEFTLNLSEYSLGTGIYFVRLLNGADEIEYKVMINQ